MLFLNLLIEVFIAVSFCFQLRSASQSNNDVIHIPGHGVKRRLVVCKIFLFERYGSAGLCKGCNRGLKTRTVHLKRTHLLFVLFFALVGEHGNYVHLIVSKSWYSFP